MSIAADHETVLLEEAVDVLMVNDHGIYIDGTYGRGGHAALLVDRLSPEGRVLAIDKDPEAIEDARQRWADEPRFEIEQGSFAEMAEFADRRHWLGRVQGVLLDLGVSSPQLDNAERGFSFLKSGRLDMRMNPNEGQSATQWLATATEREIADVLYEYGDERYSRRIARAIIRAREQAAIEDTLHLAEIIADAVPRHEKGKHPATRSFQAIRIFINKELDDLQKGLEAAVTVLASGGRLAVISFHSLEDRIVKRFMRRETQGEPVPRRLPVTGEAAAGRLRLVGKAVRPSDREVAANPRARSAIMRVAERL
jgi:16S rRNA (cytosine1402-N4)-methyltransferase